MAWLPESTKEISDKEKDPLYKGCVVVFYPREVKEIIRDILETFAEGNINDLGNVSPELLDSIFCVKVKAIDDAKQKRRYTQPKCIILKRFSDKHSRFVTSLRGIPPDQIIYEMYIYAEKWDLLSKEEKIRAILHELWHFDPLDPDKFRLHDRFEMEYILLKKYLEAKDSATVKKAEMIAVAMAKRKKKPIEEER